MRVSMLRRRRRSTVDALTAMYDAILATEPDVPLLFRLTSYRGQQVLWQDHLGTIPVEDIGDPTGGVSHPETGDIFSVQTTDGSRPIWGGEDVGLIYDGSSDHLVYVGGADTPWLYTDEQAIVRVHDISSTGNRGWVSKFGSGTDGTFYLSRRTGNIIRYATVINDTRSDLDVSGIGTDEELVFARYDGNEKSIELINSETSNIATEPMTGDLSESPQNLEIGALTGVGWYFSGTEKMTLIYGRDLTGAEYDALKDLLRP